MKDCKQFPFLTEFLLPMLRFPFSNSLPLLLAVAALASPLAAQLPTLPAKPTAVAPAGEKPEETEARLQLWLKEARAAFALASEPGAETRLPLGIDPAAFADYRRDLEQLISGIQQLQKVLVNLPEARKATEAARVANESWNGFSVGPPHSVLLIDELMNQEEAIRGKVLSFRSSEELFNRRLGSVQEEAKLSEANSRRLQDAAAANAGNDNAAAWRVTADRAKSRYLAIRGGFLQNNLRLIQEQAEAAKLQLMLLDRQISTAQKQAVFSDEDLEKVKKAAADRQASLRKEIATMRKTQQDATAARAKAQTALDLLNKPADENTPIVQTPALALAALRLEAAEARVESLQFISDNLESLIQLETHGLDLYQKRKSLMENPSKNPNAPDLLFLRNGYDRLAAWESVTANDLAGINADLRNQESRLTTLTDEDPQLELMDDIRDALWAKQTNIQRVYQAINSQQQLLKRWLDEFAPTSEQQPISEKVSHITSSTWAFFKQIWGFEVSQYDVTTVIDGVPLTVNKAVTLSQFIIAIFYFSISYYIANRIKNRFRDIVVRRGHIADAQARTLSNWMMILVGFLLIVSTLAFLKIPLTVFAFFGGALAIGIGFGAQTLIKNFISGIIVLFERKVRVGDIVDVGGVTGSIIEINTRSSVLKGADGKETLIPNSLFLENKVTNLTLTNRLVRRKITVPVALGTSPAAVTVILKETIERHGLVLKSPEPIVTFEDFIENALIFAIYFWTEFNDKTNSDVVASDLRYMIEKRFSETGIAFPDKH
jgi:potassium-dependent mechanosensitive channel